VPELEPDVGNVAKFTDDYDVGIGRQHRSCFFKQMVYAARSVLDSRDRRGVGSDASL